MNLRLADTINNATEYIAQLSAMPDKDLQRKLCIVREQQLLAFQQPKSDSLELLHLWEEQIITARYIKDEEEKQVARLKSEVVAQKKIISEPVLSDEATDNAEPLPEVAELPEVNQLALF